MAVVEAAVTLDREQLARIQAELKKQQLEGWLLYDFRGNNPVAERVLGLPAMTRRYFVLLPVSGDPIAITHRIEQQPWRTWFGENRQYLSWMELESTLREVLSGRGTVAMEYSPDDGIPYVDRMPAGVLELVRSSGITVRSSADLVSAFHSRWSEAGLASHMRASTVLQETARGAFEEIGRALRDGDRPTELTVRDWIRAEFDRRGLKVGGDAIVAVNANAANPHYAPSREAHAPIVPGDVVLIDLWGKESPDAVYADQTWMGYVGDTLPDRLQAIWDAVRDARESAITAAVEGWRAGGPVTGAELDDAARNVIETRGFGPHFIHRTGHSIDTELHGSGPNLDNLESRDSRHLIPGIGFSIEPGVYLAGDVGFRTEVDVYVDADGPRVTTPDRQDQPFLIRS